MTARGWADPARRAPRLPAWIVVGALAAGLAARAFAETPIPDAPARWVTDRAGFLSPAAVTDLDGRLGTYAQQTGHQILVYIDRTTGGVPIEDWANRAFQKWRVGRKGVDDGAVLFIFSDDHRLRIEVGYGLEDRLTDLQASRIINERVVPLIRAGDRDGAVRAGVGALLAAVGAPPGTRPLAGAPDAARPPPHPPWWVIAGGLVVLVLLFRFAARHPFLASMMMMNIGSGRRDGGWGGGGWGGGGGGGFSGGGGSSGGGGASGSW